MLKRGEGVKERLVHITVSIITNTNEYYDELKDAATHSHDTLSSNARYK